MNGKDLFTVRDLLDERKESHEKVHDLERIRRDHETETLMTETRRLKEQIDTMLGRTVGIGIGVTAINVVIAVVTIASRFIH